MKTQLDNSTDTGFVLAIVSALWLFAVEHFICGTLNTVVVAWIILGKL